jgi:hypothetical protein
MTDEHWTMGKTEQVKVIYTEPSENEKKMLEGTLNPLELLEIEKQDALQPPEGKNEKDRRKEYITQVKCYALTKIGKKPLDNPSTFNQEAKIRLMETMDEIIKTMTEEQIKIEFDRAINEHVFTTTSMPYEDLFK